MKKLLVTAALLLTATTASAQQGAACATEEEVTALMAQAGYVPFIGGVKREEGAAFWFYINPVTGAWMIHSLDLNADEECHLVSGGEYFIPGSPV